MIWTDDPVRDAEAYMLEEEKRIMKLPECGFCGRHIQDDKALYLFDTWICEDCVDDNKRRIEEEDYYGY